MKIKFNQSKNTSFKRSITPKPKYFVITTIVLAIVVGGLIYFVHPPFNWHSPLFVFYLLLFAVIGYLNGMFERMFYDDDIKLPIGLISASELFYGIITYVGMYMLRGDFAFGERLVQIILPELVYTILVTLVLYQIILHVNKRLEAEEQRSASKFV